MRALLVSPRLQLVWALLLTLSLALPGCGFRLRGAMTLPPQMEVTYIEQRGVSAELLTQLRRALLGAGVRVAATPDEATAVLRIVDENRARRVLSVDRTGRVSEYQLHYAVTFELRDGEGQALLAPQSVSLERTLRFDEGNVLGAASEQEVMQREMTAFAVRQMMRRIQALERR